MPLSDRDYMRSSYRERSPFIALYWLIGTLVGVFILGSVLFQVSNGRIRIDIPLALTLNAIESGYIWTLLTYGLIHGGFFHLVLNCLGIFFVGRILITLIGGQRFLILFGLSVFMGAVGWFMVNFAGPKYVPVVGASGGLTGLIAAFAFLIPNQPIQALLFFVIPVRITPMGLFKFVLIFDLVGMILLEIMNLNVSSIRIAHSAHLGGLLGGWAFVRFILNQDFSFSKPDIRPPKWFTSKKTGNATTGRFKINFTNRRELQKEVDRILDKINKQGFGSLTEEERNTLDRAKELLNK